MIGSVFQVMWLRLWRDRGALILAFVLPGFIFAIFAAIFSNASGGQLYLRVSMSLETDAPASVELAKTLQADDSLSLSFEADWSESDIRERVRLGQDDVGLTIVGDIAQPTPPPIRVIKDSSRDIAVSVLKGHIQQVMANQAGQTATAMFEDISALPGAANHGPDDRSVIYYVGATSILFLLFSAMQGASLSLEERHNSISDRILAGPVGTLKILGGKFAFLTLIGTVQAALIVVVAWLFFDVPVLNKLPALGLACLGAASLSAGSALLVASLTDSLAQMNTVATFTVLLASAMGGSMVPRFMMPDWLQAIGMFTPNYWAIEAFYGLLARGQSVADLLPVWSVLFCGGAATLILATIISHRMMRL
ncbi:MAG: ABC transporter permease [Hyphomonadaceae bacterium]|nr:ABC transporter permease [Hyphomonadaceae bacterium]